MWGSGAGLNATIRDWRPGELDGWTCGDGVHLRAG